MAAKSQKPGHGNEWTLAEWVDRGRWYLVGVLCPLSFLLVSLIIIWKGWSDTKQVVEDQRRALEVEKGNLAGQSHHFRQTAQDGLTRTRC